MGLISCGEPTMVPPRSAPAASASFSLLTIKPPSMLRFFDEIYRHPDEPINSNTFRRENAATLGYAKVKLLVSPEGRVLKRNVLESGGQMWRLVAASIYRLEFQPGASAGLGPWNVDIYISAKGPDPSQVPPDKDPHPFYKPEGEWTVTILSVTSTRSETKRATQAP